MHYGNFSWKNFYKLQYLQIKGVEKDHSAEPKFAKFNRLPAFYLCEYGMYTVSAPIERHSWLERQLE